MIFFEAVVKSGAKEAALPKPWAAKLIAEKILEGMQGALALIIKYHGLAWTKRCKASTTKAE